MYIGTPIHKGQDYDCGDGNSRVYIPSDDTPPMGWRVVVRIVSTGFGSHRVEGTNDMAHRENITIFVQSNMYLSPLFNDLGSSGEYRKHLG